MILVDTSVWVAHLRARRSSLTALLVQGRVVCHPFVIGEIALGALKNRAEILSLLAELPVARVAGHEDVLTLVRQRALAGRGIGWVDAHLVASALIERLPLWTRDRHLRSVARDLDAAWEGDTTSSPD